MEKQLKQFYKFLEVDKKVSNNTLQSYKRDIIQYQNYIEENQINYTKVSKEDIKTYLNYLKKVGKKSSTISRNLASIRSFYQFLIRNRKIKNDPTEDVQSPKVEKRIPSYMAIPPRASRNTSQHRVESSYAHHVHRHALRLGFETDRATDFLL